MGVTAQLSKALDDLTPLKRKSMSDEFPSVESKRSKSTSHSLDLGSFLDRLISYRPGNWNSFHPLNPLTAASWGWSCRSETSIHCVSCKGSLLTSLPKRSLPSIFHKTANILKNRITSSSEDGGGHDKFCPWLVTHSPDIFQEIHLASQLNTPLEDLLEGFNNEWLHPLSQLLRFETVPYIPRAFRPRKINAVKILEILKEDLCISEQLLRESALILALCGWTTKSPSVLQCNVCQREVGTISLPSTRDKVSLERERRDLLALGEVERQANDERANAQKIEENESNNRVDSDSNNSRDGSHSSNEEITDNISTPTGSVHGTNSEESMEDDEEENQHLSPEYSDSSTSKSGGYEEEEEEKVDERSNDGSIIEIISSDEEEVLREDTSLPQENEQCSGESSDEAEEVAPANEEPSRDSLRPEVDLSMSEEPSESVTKEQKGVDLCKDQSTKAAVEEEKDNYSRSEEPNPSIDGGKDDKDVEDTQESITEAQTVVFFNPISQHQPWCSWINKGPSTGQTGYETISFIIENKLRNKNKDKSMWHSSSPCHTVQNKMKKVISVLDSIMN